MTAGSGGVVGVNEVNFVGVAVVANNRALVEGCVVVNDQQAVDGQLGDSLEDIFTGDGEVGVACSSVCAEVDCESVGNVSDKAVFAALDIVEGYGCVGLISV